jgi:hypothetical protein
MGYDNTPNALGRLPIRITLIKYYVELIRYRTSLKVRIFRYYIVITISIRSLSNYNKKPFE